MFTMLAIVPVFGFLVSRFKRGQFIPASYLFFVGCLVLFILVLSRFILMIPMAALVGVMFMVVIGTFEWASLRTWKKIPMTDVLVMILVAGYTVLFHNLAMAVILGVIVQSLVFAWNHATHLFADKQTNEFGSRSESC